MGFIEAVQYMTNLPLDDKFDMATDAFLTFQPAFEHLDPENGGMKYVYALIGSAIASVF